LISRNAKNGFSAYGLRTSARPEASMKSRKFAGAVAALVAIAMAAPALAASDWPDSIDQYVTQVRKTIDTTDMDGYRAVVEDPKGALLVDVREDSEFKAGHVPGTVNVSRGRLEFRIWQPLGYPGKVDLNRKIYVQCATGSRATLAAKQLKDLGFTNVTAVVMDLGEWQKKGHPYVKDAAK
jgi:rhodanese-related sulfurtransferase